MPVLKVNNQQYDLRPGQHRVGGGDADIPIIADGVQAIVDVAEADQVVIRPVPDANVRVNGVPLATPSPLMHGDKLEIAGQELLFADETKAGDTQQISKIDPMLLPPSEPDLSGQPHGPPSGGRLISLVDGKEYLVPPEGLRIGRDPGSDVVINQTQVSRRHATITATAAGYEIKDYSSNGLKVNGLKIGASYVLSRGDVLKIGTEEFRFYADNVALAPTLAFGAVPHHKSKRATPRRGTVTSAALATTGTAHRVSGEQPAVKPAPAPPAPPPKSADLSWVWGLLMLALLAAAFYYFIR
jgi:pSer/pThr/pTyr-binding forkhead associated (FHA) protein